MVRAGREPAIYGFEVQRPNHSAKQKSCCSRKQPVFLLPRQALGDQCFLGEGGGQLSNRTRVFLLSVGNDVNSYGLPYCLRNRKHVPCFYRVIQTRVEVWENEKCCGNTSHRRVFPQLFRVLPNFHECFYNSIETRSTCFLFLLKNTATTKKKTTC